MENCNLLKNDNDFKVVKINEEKKESINKINTKALIISDNEEENINKNIKIKYYFYFQYCLLLHLALLFLLFFITIVKTI